MTKAIKIVAAAVAIVAIVVLASTASPPEIEWQTCLGGTGDDRANEIQQTTDGGYVVAGWSGSDDGDVAGHHGGFYDMWVVKLAPDGALQWRRSLGGTSGDKANSIQQTSDGGYVVAGGSGSNNGDAAGNHGGGGDMWVLKLAPDGELQWQKSLGGTGYERAESIQQTSDGGYVVAGASDSRNGDASGNHGRFDMWVVKLAPDGALQWQRSLGGSQNDEAYSIQQTSDGGYVVAGKSESNDGDVTGSHGYNRADMWVVKLAPDGALQWQRSLGGSRTDEAYSIHQTSDGGYVVAGRSYSDGSYVVSGITHRKDGDVTGLHGGGADMWVVKLAADGALQWQKSLGGSGHDFASSIRQTTDGGYVVAGGSDWNDGDVTVNHGNRNRVMDMWVVKLAPDGDLRWQKSLGGTGEDFATSIQQTSDGGHVVAGRSGSNDGDVTGNHRMGDMWVVKLSPDRGWYSFTW